MGYNRSESKTSRRVKRAKTNKRNNKRKQTFRKSRRVNRGGNVRKKRMLEEDASQHMEDDSSQNMEVDDSQPNSLEAKALQNNENNNYDPDSKERNQLNQTKDDKNELTRVANVKSDMYRMPYGAGEVVNQTKKIENAKKQRRLMDDMDAETEGEDGNLVGGPLMFGGKKRRTMKRK